jgi:hypothetical protein
MRPGPVSDRIGESRADRILDYVAASGDEVVLAVDRPGGEAACEEWAEAVVTMVERLRVAAEQALQPAGEPGLGAVDDEVVMRGHQAQRVHRPAVALGAAEDQPEKPAAIVVVAEDRAAVHAA